MNFISIVLLGFLIFAIIQNVLLSTKVDFYKKREDSKMTDFIKAIRKQVYEEAGIKKGFIKEQHNMLQDINTFICGIIAKDTTGELENKYTKILNKYSDKI